MNASGGIGYHLAALRFAARLWAPFREDLARELARRIPAPETIDLVLIGPSGGYCLDAAFFGRFRSVTAVDLDLLAGAVLRTRLPKARFVRQDFLRNLADADWDLDRWIFTLGAPPGSTVLFSNLLGQLGFLHDEARMREIGRGLARALGGKIAWISFHDRFSVTTGTARADLEFPERPESRALADAWTAKWDAGARGTVGEIEEHEIGEWTRAARGPFRYFAWRLESRRTQLIEVCGN